MLAYELSRDRAKAARDAAATATRTMAANIKELRKAMCLTQETAAQRLGVTVSTWNRWERGKARPSRMAREWLRELARKVGYDGL